MLQINHQYYDVSIAHRIYKGKYTLVQCNLIRKMMIIDIYSTFNINLKTM